MQDGCSRFSISPVCVVDQSGVEQLETPFVVAFAQVVCFFRYGIDTELLWSRLEMVVPKDQQEQLASYQRALSALLHMNLALAVLAVFANTRGYQHQQLRSLALAIGALIASRLCLLAAECSASGLASKIEAVVDQGVPAWLQAIGLSPDTAGARLETLHQLAKFLGGGTALPKSFRFNAPVHPVGKTRNSAGKEK